MMFSPKRRLLPILLLFLTSPFALRQFHPASLRSDSTSKAPRISFSWFNETFDASNNNAMSKLNVTLATTIYHLGWDNHGGRTNNHLITVLHALDLAFDQHGDIANDGSNCVIAVAVSGWAYDTLRKFFFDENTAEDWDLKLEQTVPILHFDRINQLPGEKRLVKLAVHPTYHYTRNHLSKASVDRIEKRRRLILGQLFRHASKRNFETLNLLKAHLDNVTYAKEDEHLRGKYMVVHSRWLEGECYWRVGDKLPKDECDMKPSYIKDILRSLGLLGRIPIIVISDMQRPEILSALKNDEEIGRQVIVPALDPRFNMTNSSISVESDMMIAIKSDIFVGTRASSMAVMVGLVRVLSGADPKTNYVYVTQRDGNLEVCSECIFFCNDTRSTICGERVIYP